MLAHTRLVCLIAIWLLLLGPIVVLAGGVSPTEVDNFEDGTTENWRIGIPGTEPSNEPDGGPTGAGDNYLQMESTSTGGPGSRMAVFNEMQWLGDYNALGGEVEITLSLANLGSAPLAIRLGVERVVSAAAGEGPTPGGGRTRYVSTTPFMLPADGVWRETSFILGASDMTLVGGSGALSDVLAGVEQFRLLSAASASWMGDAVAATLGVDNVRITAVPVELMSFSIE